MIMTFINLQEGVRGPDRRMSPDPEYEFQGAFDSVRSRVKYKFLENLPKSRSFASKFYLDEPGAGWFQDVAIQERITKVLRRSKT